MNLCDKIMVWEYKDKLQMGPSSIKERVENVDKVK